MCFFSFELRDRSLFIGGVWGGGGVAGDFRGGPEILDTKKGGVLE